MRWLAFPCALVVLSCHAAWGAPTMLPLKSLRLYETGVGYFERSGPVSQRGLTSLPVPAGHLDDALKTLVVLSDKGQALVHGVEFGSSMSRGMARALAGLPAEDGAISYHDLLASLKGAAVKVQTQREALAGRIVEVLETTEEVVEERPAQKGEPAQKAVVRRRPELTVLLLTERSEIRRLRGSELVSVKPAEASSASRLSSALDALSTRGAQTRRLLRLLGESNGPVTLGYIAETAIWRTTYRLVLNRQGGAGGVLQAWALLHNDADEDWRGVQVHLVSGRPDSFLYPLAAPRYGRRELVHPENELSTVPQLLDTTVDAIWGDHTISEGLGLVGTGVGGGGSGEGSIGLGSIGTIGHGSGSGAASSSSLLDVGNLAGVAEASGVESGALFSYALSAPLDLRAHGSALVPFLQQTIDAEPITWVAAPGEAARSAIRLKNSTRQTMPAGPIAVFADGGFAGEAVLERLKPGEQRFLQHGADLDLELLLKETRSREEPRRLVLEGDVLVEHYLRHSDVTYDIENRSERPRRVYLALSFDRNARLTGADRLERDGKAGRALAVFDVAGRKRLDRAVKVVEGLARRHAVDGLSAAWLSELAAQPGLLPAERAAAGEAAAIRREIEGLGKEGGRDKEETGRIEEDLKRWRENLRALGGEKGQASAFVKRMLAAEDRLKDLQRRAAQREEEIARRKDAARAALGRLRGKS